MRRRDVLVGIGVLSFFASAREVKAMTRSRGVTVIDRLQHLRLEHTTRYVPQIGVDENAEHFIELDPDSSGSLVTSITLNGGIFENITFKFLGRFTRREVFPRGRGASVQTSKFDPKLYALMVFSGDQLVAFL